MFSALKRWQKKTIPSGFLEKKTPGAGFQEEKPAIEDTELEEVVKLQVERDSPKYAHPKMPTLPREYFHVGDHSFY